MALSTTCRKILCSRNKLFFTPCRTKYYVLLPEIPQDEPDTNALLRDDDIPDYSSLTKEKCANAAIKRAIDYSSGLHKVENSVKTKFSKKDGASAEKVFQHLIEPMDILRQPLEAVWGHIQTLHFSDQNVVPRSCYNSLSSKTGSALMRRFQSPLILNLCKDALEKAERGSITEEQAQVLKKYVVLSKLNGMHLEGTEAAKFFGLQYELNRRRSYFDYKAELGEKMYEMSIPSSNAKIVNEFPQVLLEATATNKKDPSLGPWVIPLKPVIVNLFLEYCSDSDKRSELWQASMSRNSNIDDSKLYSSVDLEEIRDKRNGIAVVLGFKTYADMSTQTTMAGSVDNVLSVLDQLLEKARPAQVFEIESLNKFASSNGFHKTIDIWDVSYWKRRQQIASFGFNQEKLRDYFPLDRVLNGLFGLTKKLFNIDVRLNPDVQTWHPDCRYYEIFEGGEADPIASFIMDPYQREGKPFDMGIAGNVTSIRPRSGVGRVQKPMCAIINVFSPPTLGRPALLSFEELQHLFRNFGHALHILLTRCKYSDVSGRNFMDWDAAEISSEFFGKWVYNEKVLSSVSGHFISDEPLPKEIFDNLNRVRRHMAGYELCKHLYRARLDLELHSTTHFWHRIMSELWPRHFVFPLHEKDYHPCHDTDIISGMWASRYFSVIWWKLLGADVFSAFQEAGLDNDEQLSAVGKRYRDTFLACGGGAPSSELFRRFRGRDLSPTAFLHLTGLQKPAKTPLNKS